MSKQKKRPHPSRRMAWIKAGALVILMIAAFVILIGRNELPKNMRDQKAVVFVYDLKDRLTKKSEPPKAPVKTEQGYSTDDRAQIDKIISKGAAD